MYEGKLNFKLNLHITESFKKKKIVTLIILVIIVTFILIYLFKESYNSARTKLKSRKNLKIKKTYKKGSIHFFLQ